MNVLLCSMSVPWPKRPTLGAYHVSQLLAMRAAGCGVEILSPAPWCPRSMGVVHAKVRAHVERPERYEVRGVQVSSPRAVYAFPRVVRGAGARLMPRVVSGVSRWMLRPLVERACTRMGADVILAHGVMPWGEACVATAQRLGKRVCFIEHSAEDVLRLDASTALGRHYVNVASQASCVFVVGEPMRRHLAEKLGLSRVVCVPNGVEWMDVQEKREEKLVVAATHYYRRKGLEELVEAWPRVVEAVPRARLELVTNAPESLAELVRRSPVRESMALLPLEASDALRRRMARASLFALPSVGEAFGLVYAEALSVGTGVLMTRDCGMAELVGDVTSPLGVVIEQVSVASVAAGVVMALRHGAWLRGCGERGAACVRSTFTWEANARVMLGAMRAFGVGSSKAGG